METLLVREGNNHTNRSPTLTVSPSIEQIAPRVIFSYTYLKSSSMGYCSTYVS